jgi:hypothetical protein
MTAMALEEAGQLLAGLPQAAHRRKPYGSRIAS